MCGIVAIRCMHNNVITDALHALDALEYRGYDSAGLAFITPDEAMHCFYSLEGIGKLRDDVTQTHLTASVAIGHTRWATHGKPSLCNTHPIICGPIAIVHNGIIENYRHLADTLCQRTHYHFASETDTEVLGAWIAYYVSQHDSLQTAAIRAVQQTKGDFSFVAINHTTQEMIAYAQGTSLVCDQTDHRLMIVSDPAAFRQEQTTAFALPEQTYLSVNTAGHTTLIDAQGHTHRLSADDYFHYRKQDSHKGMHAFFMHKEIHEQTQTVAQTARCIAEQWQQLQNAQTQSWLQPLQHIVIIACGSSYHAGLCARNWFETQIGCPTQVDIASEFAHRRCRFAEDTLFIAISQSGETYDTVHAVTQLREAGYTRILGICNAPHTRLSRLCHGTLMTEAGPEIGVASTKAFTAQLICLYQLSHLLSGHPLPAHLPHQLMHTVSQALAAEQTMQEWSQVLAQHPHIFFIGRGIYQAIAMEGALKMKEVSYRHAEAFATGELKHGPLALLEPDTPVVFLLPADEHTHKSLSNLQEILSRGSPVFVITSHDPLPIGIHAHCHLSTPDNPSLTPILYTITLQLLAYHTAVARGLNADRPRHLAKSVTVE